jgi:photosystem II stability/assembly factor-like uncharacterized protein
MRRFSIVFFVLLLTATTVDAAWTRARLFGADVRALIVHPQKPDVLFLGTSTGELYRSTDGGKSWSTPRVGTPFPGHVVDNLVVDSKGRLWVAAWGLWGGGVIAMSSDEGVTWSRRDKGLEEFSVRAIAIDHQDPDLIVVGGLDGVHRSRNSGKGWEKISDQINVESLAIDPRASDTIYVGTWRQAWRTDDGGKSWKHIEKGMVLDTDVFTFHINPKNPDNLWVATCGWVYNSPDRGDTWTRFRDGFDNRRIHDVDVDPHDDNIVYAASVAGLYRSTDAGKIFSRISDDTLVINALALHPDRPGRIVLGTEGDGVYVSNDGGKTFERSSLGLYNVRVASVVPDPDIQGKVYSVVYFGGNASGIYVSSDGGEEWDKLSRTKLPEILSLVVQKSGIGPKFLVGTEKGFYWSLDGAEWTPTDPAAIPMRVEKIVRYNDIRLFAATSEGVYTSKDGGRQWYRLASLRERTVDIALGHLGQKRSLYALTTAGLLVFDGESWLKINGAPERGKQLAVRRDGDLELVVIGSGQGLKAGRVDYAGVWKPVELPDGHYIDVHQANHRELLVLGSRQSHELLVGGSTEGDWKKVMAPLEPTGIMDVAVDHFDEGKFYFGTRGEGIFIYRDATKGRTRTAASRAQSAAGSK